MWCERCEFVSEDAFGGRNRDGYRFVIGKVQSDLRKNRLRSFFRICFILLVPVMYLSYALSGLFLLEIDIHSFRDQIVWCLTNPIEVGNAKSTTMVAVGILVWGVFAFNYYLKLNYNLMHGQEYGAAKWGDIYLFNEKYAAEDEHENKILSENIRFKYDLSTLRNNNIVVVDDNDIIGLSQVTSRTEKATAA